MYVYIYICIYIYIYVCTVFFCWFVKCIGCNMEHMMIPRAIYWTVATGGFHIHAHLGSGLDILRLVPSGKRTWRSGKSPCLGKSTIKYYK